MTGRFLQQLLGKRQDVVLRTEHTLLCQTVRYLCRGIPLQLQRKRAPLKTTSCQPFDKFQNDMVQLDDNLRTDMKILQESALATHRFPFMKSDDRPVVNTA